MNPPATSAVEPVAPGLWSVRVPIPDNPLGFVFSYLFATLRGPVVVDPGWNADASYDALVAGFRAVGLDVGDLHAVLLTHHHRDHSGLAGRLQEESRAFVAIHAEDEAILADPSWFLHGLASGALEPDGVPYAEEAAMRDAAIRWSDPIVPVREVRTIGDGEAMDVPDWDVQAVWTPGHTPGHMCFTVKVGRRRLLLSGDHVLPRITPNVGLTSVINVNPLRDYRASLEKLLARDVADEVLPAHEWRFSNLAGRVRQIQVHHEARLTEVKEILSAGPMTAWQLASTLTWSRGWDELGPLARRSALNETRAHLAYLQDESAVTSTGDRPMLFVRS